MHLYDVLIMYCADCNIICRLKLLSSPCVPDSGVRVATRFHHHVDDPPLLSSIPGHRSLVLTLQLCPPDVQLP